MRRVVLLALSAGLVAVLPGWGWAAEVTLTAVGPPVVYHPVGHSIDLDGVAPGMSPKAVAEALSQNYGEVQVTQENLGLADGGTSVATQNFITRMTARKDGNDIAVWFGTPTTGNAVVQVTKQTSYPDPAQAPALSAVVGQLVAQFGPPALDAPAVGSGEIKLLAWSYKNDKPSPCTDAGCRADMTDGLDVADLATYRRAVKNGHDLTILGMLLTDISDANKAASLVITVSDAATKLRTLDAAVAQMRSAIHGGGKVPPAPPKR